MSHARARTGFWSGQQGGPGRRRRPGGQVRKTARSHGQIKAESLEITSAEP